MSSSARESSLIAPGGEVERRPGVGAPGIRIADIGREELDEALAGLWRADEERRQVHRLRIERVDKLTHDGLLSEWRRAQKTIDRAMTIDVHNPRQTPAKHNRRYLRD